MTQPRHRLVGGGWRTTPLLVVVALAMFVLAMMSIDVLRKLDDQATANSDSRLWSLTQAEVEFRRMELALARAQTGEPEQLADLRQRFDVFYGRIVSLSTGKVYEILRELPQETEPSRIRADLDLAVPLIDSDDATLLAGLEELSQQVKPMADRVRHLATEGIDVFAKIADESRGAVSATLTRVAIVTLVLIAMLIGMVIWVLRMWRDARDLAEAAHEASTRYSAILSASLDAVLAADSAGRILEFNGASERLFGHQRSEVLGRDIAGLIEPAHLRDRISTAMAQVAATGDIGALPEGRITGQARTKAGEFIPVELSVSTARQGRDIIFVAFLSDITARREAEAELLRARDDALAGEKAKADLLAVMSHEMRTPLNGLLGTMELLRDSDLDPAQREQLRIMEKSGQLLLGHVNDVLDISRLDAGKVDICQENFHLGQILEDIVDGQRSLADANGNTLSVDLDPTLPTHVAGDPARLRQVLLNLVGNAVKFTRNGAITLEAERVVSTDLVELRVIDTGVGMNAADLARIFDDFVTLDTSYSRRSDGTGLGLGIVRRLVHAMNGQVGAESAAGEGSQFWMRLPLPSAPAPGASDQATEDAETEPGSPRDVLVVEDNEINRLVVGEMLHRAGHSVRFAHDGKEGVTAAAERRVDLILMDISMPVMDGVAAARAIREGNGPNRDTEIVALTAHALPTDIARFHAAGMTRVLTKPLSRLALGRMMADLPLGALPNGTQEAAEIVDKSVHAAVFDDLGCDRASELLERFLTETASTIDALSNADASYPAEQIISNSHKIAGAAAIFGAVELTARLRDIETLGKTGAEEKMRAALPDLMSVWRDTASALSERLDDAA